MNISLLGRTAIITGANQGLGEAIAKAYSAMEFLKYLSNREKSVPPPKIEISLFLN